MSKRAWGWNGWLAAVAACLGLGCGARALVEPSSDGDDPVGQGGGRAGSAGGPTSAGAGARGATSPGRPDEGGEAVDVIPDPCADSFRRSDDRDRDCPYIYRGICYSSDDCACSRACSSEAQCVIEGFLEPDEPERIRCISP